MITLCDDNNNQVAYLQKLKAGSVGNHGSFVYTGVPEDNSTLQNQFLQFKDRTEGKATDKKSLRREKIWYPRTLADLDQCNQMESNLKQDGAEIFHPVFLEESYCRRRKEIGELAKNYRFGDALPRVQYTEAEVKAWSTIYVRLSKQHELYACKEYIESFELLQKSSIFSSNFIPQVSDVSKFLFGRSGYQLRPVAGLLSSRDFLASLALRVFRCAQYVRHSESLEYSPEPDIIHEMIGHVPMLANPVFAQFSQEIGIASLGASDEDIIKLSTNAMSPAPQLRLFDPWTVSTVSYQDQTYQPLYFIAESISDVMSKLRQFTASMKRPIKLRFDEASQAIQEIH